MGNVIGRIVPAAVMVAGLGLAGCNDAEVQFSGDGVPLAELDMSTPPTEVALASPDTVVITAGDGFTIDVDGSASARERMRFTLDEGTLGIHREEGDGGPGDTATVNITMPAPDALVMAGSGTMRADAMAQDEPTIAVVGSGKITADDIAAREFQVVIGGSGSVNASGRADRLNLNIGGSGSADLANFEAGDAEINLAGSGGARFASDGNVEANVAGSGTVRVRGSATCTVNSVGSGTLVCEPRAAASTQTENDAA